jgi:hypothetical protein
MSPGGSSRRAIWKLRRTRRADPEVAEDPAVDCFYAYPTASSDPGPLADLDVDDSGIGRLGPGGAVRYHMPVFAPAYRQIPAAVVSAGRDSA